MKIYHPKDIEVGKKYRCPDGHIHLGCGMLELREKHYEFKGLVALEGEDEGRMIHNDMDDPDILWFWNQGYELIEE